MKGAAKGLGISLGGMGILVAVLLLILKRGPFAALVGVLLASALVFVIGVVQAVIGKKDG